MPDPLYSVENLRVRFDAAEVVRGISFTLGREKVGLVGESGSGKSMTARALLGLIRRPGLVTADRLDFAGTDLRDASPATWRTLRGSGIGFVLQDPKYALNPVIPVGRQIEETLILHAKLSRAERRERVLEAMADVGLPNPAKLYDAFPHEVSGGMGQRVMLAAMTINRPRLLIADEPTSALDAGTRNQVLDLLDRLAAERDMGVFLISHDLPLVSGFCDRLLVMYRGEIVDSCRADELKNARSAYTRTLWDCRPSAATRGTRLPTLDRAAFGETA